MLLMLSVAKLQSLSKEFDEVNSLNKWKMFIKIMSNDCAGFTTLPNKYMTVIEP